MQEKATPALSKYTYLLYAVFACLLFFLYHGYQFNQGDQIEHLLPVYQKIDPSLFRYDFYMQMYNQTFTVRYFYVWLVYLGSFIAPVSTVCFILNFLCIFFSVSGFMRMTSLLSESRAAILLAPLFIYILLYNATIGGNHIEYSILTSSTLAKAFAAWALVFFLEKKIPLAALLLGIGALFQVLVGFQLFLILSGIMVLRIRKYSFKSLVLFVLVFLLTSSSMLLPMLSKQLFTQEVYDKELYALIMNVFRNPIHFQPSLFPLKDYVVHFVLLIMAGLALWKSPLRHKRFFVYFALLALAGMLVYTILYELLHVYDISKTQWFKTTIWIGAFGGCIIAITLARWLRLDRLLDKSRKYVNALLVAGILAGSFVLLFSAYVPIHKLQGRYKIGVYQKTDLEKLDEWIEANTDKDAIFLVSPADDAFQCIAKRAMPVSYKAIIHEPFFMFPWYERVKDIYGVSLEQMEKGKTALQQAEELYKTRYFADAGRYKIDYRIDNLKECRYRQELGPVIKRYGDWVLTEYKK